MPWLVITDVLVLMHPSIYIVDNGLWFTPLKEQNNNIKMDGVGHKRPQQKITIEQHDDWYIGLSWVGCYIYKKGLYR